MHARNETAEWLESVRSSVASLLGSGTPTIQRVAKARRTSVRTLQRRLAALDTTYSTVVDEARMQMAALHLRKPDVKLYELSKLLGFADPGSFSRAFKRWTGSTPRDYRRGVLRKQAGSGGRRAGQRDRLPA